MNLVNNIGQRLDLRTDLVLRYRFQETSGDAKDSSGNDYNGTVTGATQTINGVDIDGVNDEISNTAAALLTALENISVFTIFIRCSAPSLQATDCFFSFGESNDNDAFALYPYSSNGADGLQIWYDGEYIMQAVGDAPADDSMNDFVFRSSSATDHEAFVNGVSEATATDNKSTATSMEGVTVGRYIGNGEWGEGVVKELIIWTRALTDEQITYLSQR